VKMKHYKQIRGKEAVAIGCPIEGSQIHIDTQGLPIENIRYCPLCGNTLPYGEE
jgi:hypothetical protein